MARRYIYGPVSADFAEQNLAGQREEGHCLAFDHEGKTDLMIRDGDSWAKVTTQFPAGWKPEFIVLNLAFSFIPDSLWSAPIPIVGLAADWPLLWHYYRRRLRSCDLVLTDQAGVEALQMEGISQVRAADLYGCDRDCLCDMSPEAAQADEANRDIDILFVGNVNAAVQRERLPWLMRLARLGEKYRVMIRSAVFGDSYRKLLRRAKIVFSHVEYARQSRRHAEVAASGALLFEHARRESKMPFFGDRQECVLYDSDNLEALLEYYLEHEDERWRIATAARAKAADLTFESQWEGTLAQIERVWPALSERPRHRSLPAKWDSLGARLWQACHSPPRSDVMLIHDLDVALAAEPKSAALHNALGLALSLAYRQPRYEKAVVAVAAEQFERAVALNPSHFVARLNLAESLKANGDEQGASEQCRIALSRLERSTELDPGMLDSPQFHSGFDDFRMTWERAAWTNAGNARAEANAKKDLLRWRFQLLLARLTGDMVHHYEAYLGRPELPYSAGSLGVALASGKYPVEALAPLRRAVSENPFDRDAARALSHMLSKIGDRESRERLIEDRRLLAQAAPTLAPSEAWFSERRPSGKELASIIILCCNELESTRQCLKSVLEHTRSPYELILVDNASSDGTTEFLTEMRSCQGPVRIDVIRNETNVGFPAGCNQGIARSRGRFIVFLNNDTIVTSQWLDTLVDLSISNWPNVGLVGPVTNYAPDAQLVRPGCANISELDDFAERHRREFTGKTITVSRLTGFCLVTRREVLDRIGNFDERFGLGFFDDDDLCFRAREVGLKLLVSREVYIHHFGNTTFNALGLDTSDQLRTNMELLREKWGKEATSPYRLPPAPEVIAAETRKGAGDDTSSVEPADVPRPLTEVSLSDPKVGAEAGVENGLTAANSVAVVPNATPLEPRPNVSLCMIVKNEEARLGACLESAADLFDEIVIVDTGSTDKTKEVASRFRVRLADFPWCDSFAAARNECLRFAKGRWIMWLDADDRIDRENHAKLRKLFEKLGDGMGAYAMRVRSVMDSAGSAFRLLDQVRLFKNHPSVRWDYRVHEQTLPAVNRAGGHVRWTDIVIDHVGYQDVSVRRGKLERNLKLLELDHAERPDDAFTLFNLGWTLMDLGRMQEALAHMEHSLETAASDASIVRKLYHLIAVARRQLGQKELAREKCREGLTRFSDDTELLLEEAMILLEGKNFAEAEPNLLQLVESTPAPYFGSSDEGVRGYRTRHILASNYLDHQRPSEAEVQWRMTNSDQPKFLPAWLALGEMYLKQERWEALKQLTTDLERVAGARFEATMLRTRGHYARREYRDAVNSLKGILPDFPDAVGPRVLLSHVLLQEAKDWEAAESALRDVLRVDPGNSEAKRNLEVLLRQQQYA